MKRKLRKEVQWILLIAIMMLLVIVYSFYKVQAIQEKPIDIVLVQLEEPCSTSSVKTYMDYRSITLESSEQYKFIQEHMHIKDGYLLDEQGYIGVALGSEFGDIGTRWIFELDTGLEIYVVKIEHKDDKHTLNGCEQKNDHSVIEFVINENYFTKGSNGFIFNGNFNNNEWFNGNIIGYIKVK